MDLVEIGWTEEREAEIAVVCANQVQVRPGRVARAEAAVATVWTAAGDVTAHIPSRLRTSEDRPVVGDWVAVSQATGEVRIEAVLPRHTRFARRAAGRRMRPQVVAANVDLVFVVSGLDGDFSPRRIERYLTAVADSGARPVVLLTKASLVDNAEASVAEARSVAPGVDVHAVDVISGFAADRPTHYLTPGTTAALVGSSGVGKSTLVNHWLGQTRQRTAAVRDRDGRGQHTTTARELFVLPSGALVIDTPGMRELALWVERDGALAEAFSDLREIARGCRFADCRHGAEPGCAVAVAIADGSLDPARWQSYLALRDEVEGTRDNASEHRRRGNLGAKAMRAKAKRR